MFQLNPDGDYTYYQKSLLGIASYNYVFGPSSFIDFNASMITSDYKQYVYENPLDPRYVNPERFTEVGGNAFYTGGTQNWHFAHKTDSYTGKIDFTSQVTSIHQLKSGIEVQRHTLHYEDFQIHVDATSGFKPALPQVGNFDYNVYTNHPYQYAAYAQDKIELDYLIVNVGVRFDYFQPDGRVLKNPDNIAELDPFQPPFPDSLSNPASAKYQISPRVGISYPITDRGAIHFSYGHFFQVPPFEFLYRNPNFRIPLTGTFPAAIGNVIGNADLQPQQTTMYEVGLQQELTPFLGVTVTTYYKDIRNLLGMQLIFEPIEPRRWGPLKLHGLFLRRQPEVADVYAKIVADDIVTLANMGDHLLHGPRADRMRQMLETAVRPAVDQATGRARAAVRVAIGAREYDAIRDSIMVEAVDRTMAPLSDPELNRTQSAAIRTLLAARVRELPSSDFVEMLRAAIKEDEWMLYAHGALLGFAAGLVHLGIFGA